MKTIIVIFLILCWSALAQEDSYNDSDYSDYEPPENTEVIQDKADFNNGASNREGDDSSNIYQGDERDRDTERFQEEPYQQERYKEEPVENQERDSYED
ncbi:MAG: hypothetical protein K9K67_04650 [Bacteriovoracaceae bacterium]|nr:hypothetical protein [Bacteriovoracaceae bacterium]